MKIDVDDQGLFQIGVFSLRTFKEYLSKLDLVMEDQFSSINRDQLQGLITRYIFILNLPTEMIRLVRIYCENYEKKFIESKCSLKDFWILSVIVKLLKFLFGLDGVTEKQLSKLSDLFSSRSNIKYFSYEEWKKWLTKTCLKVNVDVIHYGDEFRKWRDDNDDKNGKFKYQQSFCINI